MKSINCKGTLIDLSTPKVMGIINVTPDSFYDGGNTTSTKEIISQAEKMLKEGATFLDIGGYSSRPGADIIPVAEEEKRVLLAVEAILKEFPRALLSIDTFRSSVAKRAAEAGAALVNDISGGMLDEDMLKTSSALKIPYILMHMKGTPQTMQQQTAYKNVTQEVLKYFSERIANARSAGINDIIIDPGFGFAKTPAQSFKLLQQMYLLKELDVPILVGVSRKSMIYKTLKTSPKEALNGTSILHTVALQNGANILRAHDVKEAIECVKLVEMLQQEIP